MDNYFAVEFQKESEIVIEKSRFITNVFPVETEAEAKAQLDKIRKKYAYATHNCYAFVTDFGQTSRSSDDGEPSGTAGVPILEVIKNQKLINTLVVVTRYFGGIKLGAGGLVRAYSKSASNGLKAGGAREFFNCDKIKIKLSYDEYSLFLREIVPVVHSVLSTDYAEDITVVVSVKKLAYKPFNDKFSAIFYDKTLENIGQEFY